MKKLFIITSAFFLITSCRNNSTELSVKEKELIVVSVKTTLEQYFVDIKQNGLTTEFKYLDNSKEFFWVPPGYKTSINYDSVKTAIERNAANFKSVDNKWEILTVNPLTPELASYTGTIKSVSIDTANTESTYRLIETGTMIKRKGEWKLLCGQTNIIE